MSSAELLRWAEAEGKRLRAMGVTPEEAQRRIEQAKREIGRALLDAAATIHSEEDLERLRKELIEILSEKPIARIKHHKRRGP